MRPSFAIFRRRLLNWFDENRRDLPWRLLAVGSSGGLDPYLVFVSEAMLQQTQVSTVVPYFERFTESFPTIGGVAEADGQEVLRHWQGLGYYRRGRGCCTRPPKRSSRNLAGRFRVTSSGC